MANRMYDTLESQVSGETSQDLTYRNLHTNLDIKDMISGNIIRIPYEQILSDYRYFLKPYIVEAELNELQYEHYRQNPHAFSYDIYGTTHLWSTVLQLNNAVNRYEFNSTRVKFYDPQKISWLINEILIKENEIN